MNIRFPVFKAAAFAGFLLAGVVAAGAADNILLPQTKLRLTVVQWNPAKGDYQSWQAIGGDFVVSEAGMLQLPVIGQIEAAGHASTALANEIAVRLQARMGLRDKPDTTVEILEYPPIYIVGDVTTPGEYKYREGLTALQALALSGGPFRQSNALPGNQIQLVGELRGIHNDIMRSKARIARLNAEMAGQSDVTFPTINPGDDDAATENAIDAQERIIFAARLKEMDRQTASLKELRTLLGSEIDVLQEKIKAADIGIANARDELERVSILVEKGIAVVSRRSELERNLANYQADRLDQVTAIMRARQSITEATRNLEGLEDKHKTDVAASLQQDQANLQHLLLDQGVKQKLLLEGLAASPSSAGGTALIGFTVTRYGNGKTNELPATESTALLPGDVVTVRLKASPAGASAGKPVVTGSLPAGRAALSNASGDGLRAEANLR